MAGSDAKPIKRRPSARCGLVKRPRATRWPSPPENSSARSPRASPILSAALSHATRSQADKEENKLLWDAAEDPGLSEHTLKALIKDRYTAAAVEGNELRLWGMYTFAGDVVAVA